MQHMIIIIHARVRPTLLCRHERHSYSALVHRDLQMLLHLIAIIIIIQYYSIIINLLVRSLCTI